MGKGGLRSTWPRILKAQAREVQACSPDSQTHRLKQETRLKISDTQAKAPPPNSQAHTWPKREDPPLQTHDRKAQVRQTHRHSSLINHRHSRRQTCSPDSVTRWQHALCPVKAAVFILLRGLGHFSPREAAPLPSLRPLHHQHSAPPRPSLGWLRGRHSDQDSLGPAPRDSDSSSGVGSISRQRTQQAGLEWGAPEDCGSTKEAHGDPACRSWPRYLPPPSWGRGHLS